MFKIPKQKTDIPELAIFLEKKSTEKICEKCFSVTRKFFWFT